MNRYIAELIGTFVLVFASCGSAVLAGDKIGFLGVSLAFGLSLLAMIYTIGPISGCHINPAVTVGLLLTKKMDPKFAGGYIAAQIVGAILAAGILLVIAQGAPGGYDPSVSGFAANGYGEHSPGKYNLLSAFLVEVVLTFFLVYTVLGTIDYKSAGRLCRHRHRFSLNPRSPGRYSGDQHFRQSRAKYRACRFRRWLGFEPAMAIYSRADYRCSDRCRALYSISQAG